MIMCSHRQYAIGERGTGLTDADNFWHPDQPFLVLRPSTVDEYFLQPAVVAAYVARGPKDNHFYFYEINVD